MTRCASTAHGRNSHPDEPDGRRHERNPRRYLILLVLKKLWLECQWQEQHRVAPRAGGQRALDDLRGVGHRKPESHGASPEHDQVKVPLPHALGAEDAQALGLFFVGQRDGVDPPGQGCGGELDNTGGDEPGGTGARALTSSRRAACARS